MAWWFQKWIKFNLLMPFERQGKRFFFVNYAVGLSRSINLILMIMVTINNRLPPGNVCTIYATCGIYSGQTWVKQCTFGRRQSF